MLPRRGPLTPPTRRACAQWGRACVPGRARRTPPLRAWAAFTPSTYRSCNPAGIPQTPPSPSCRACVRAQLNMAWCNKGNCTDTASLDLHPAGNHKRRLLSPVGPAHSRRLGLKPGGHHTQTPPLPTGLVCSASPWQGATRRGPRTLQGHTSSHRLRVYVPRLSALPVLAPRRPGHEMTPPFSSCCQQSPVQYTPTHGRGASSFVIVWMLVPTGSGCKKPGLQEATGMITRNDTFPGSPTHAASVCAQTSVLCPSG